MAKVNPSRPVPPKGTRLAGEALWSAVLDRYELEHHELLLLREIVRCVDDLDRLANMTGRGGAISASGGIDPAIAEARQMRITLATLIGALRLPADDQGEEVRLRQPQRRPVVRSVDPPAPLPMDNHVRVRAASVRRDDVRRNDVPVNAAPPGLQDSQAVVRPLNPPTNRPALRQNRHTADERAAHSPGISVTELVARVRKG